MSTVTYFDSPIGKIGVIDNGTAITNIFAGDMQVPSDDKAGISALGERAKVQFSEYFSGKRKIFDFPMKFEGTDFQKAVWTALLQIPFGNAVAYSDIAETVGSPKAYRAVGSAVGKNPLLIVVPCHRIIAKHRKLGGFSAGINVKKQLLKIEEIEYKG